MVGQSSILITSVSLTLGFDIIHHRTRGLHNHITWPGASPCVVYSPEGEPGRGRKKCSITRGNKSRGWGPAAPSSGPALSDSGRILSDVKPLMASCGQ